MSTKQTYRRLTPDILKADRAAVTALEKLNGYAPVNPAHRIEAIKALVQRLDQARQNEILTRNALAATRDEIIATERALHDSMLGVKSQVIAQYGPDSDEMAALGLKKKSKRRYGGPRATKGEQA